MVEQVLSVNDLVTVLTGLVTLLGVMWSAGRMTGKLEPKVTESLRQLAAMHKRMDTFSLDISGVKVEQAVLKERVANLRNTQRFRLPPAETLPFEGEGKA